MRRQSGQMLLKSARDLAGRFFPPRRESRRPSRRLPRLERLERRELLVVGAWQLPPPVHPEVGLDGVVEITYPDGKGGCSGTLLWTGSHVLTAAHCVDDEVGPGGQVTVDFPNSDFDMVVRDDAITIHPGFSVRNGFPQNDLAILELPALAPAQAERYQIYRGGNELGANVELVGYGMTGVGARGQEGRPGTKRHGWNRLDSLTPDDKLLVYDFDDGNPLHDTLGVLPGIRPVVDFGLGNQEAMQAEGDSGGPGFIRPSGTREIVGVVSYVVGYTREDWRQLCFRQGLDDVPNVDPSAPEREPCPSYPDVAPGPNSSFGDLGFLTRVSAFANWIDGQIGTYDVMLNMAYQESSPDGRDEVEVRYLGSEPEDIVRILVNGNLYHSDSRGDIGSMTIAAGNGADTLRVSNPERSLWFVNAADSGTVGTDLDWKPDIAFSSIEHLVGGPSVDYFVFGNEGNLSGSIDGGMEMDVLQAPSTVSGNLWLITDSDTGTLTPGANHDVSFSSIEHLKGGEFTDVFLFSDQAGISGSIDGGGISDGDTLDYGSYTTGVAVNLNSRSATGVGNGVLGRIREIENVTGGMARDVLTGDAADNVLHGRGGDDVLQGFGGDDYLFGGLGADVLFGDDFFDLSSGNDWLDGGGDGELDVLIGGRGADTFVDYVHRFWYRSWFQWRSVDSSEDDLQDVHEEDEIITHVL